MAENTWRELCVSGVTENTPKRILLNACVLYKNFKYDTSKKVWTGTLLGATSGGTKFTIAPVITNISVDGVLVNAKGLVQKVARRQRLRRTWSSLQKTG